MIALAMLLGGCTSLPSEGPLASEIVKQSEQSDYLLIDVNEEIVQNLSQFNVYGLSQRFKSEPIKKTRNVVGIGDVLAISIWEAGSGGLFSSGENNGRAEFPSIVVNKSGKISLPYASNIKVAGLSPTSIQNTIVSRLEGKAIQPQAVVSIVKNENNAVTLNGDVNRPGRYELSLRGDRLTDVIAKAGGTKYPARETYVTFIRGEKTGILLLNALMENPVENIYVQKNDQIFLIHDPKRYTVLGAVTKPGAYVFDSSRVNVLEAVANAGGLLDERADSTGLFVFRYENAKVLEKLGIYLPETDSSSNQNFPVIYRINMRHAKSYFYAQSFMLIDKDSIFVSNSDSVQFAKFLKLLNLGLTPGISAARLSAL